MRPVLDAAALDARRFPPETRDALFEAVLVNDVVDPATPLPPRAPLDHDRERLVDAHRLCRQLWREGVSRDALAAMADALVRTGDLDAEGRLAFKHARARFKHLRFAFVLYDEAHRCPPLFKALTTSLGHLQDAFRHGRRGATTLHAAALRAMLSPPYQLGLAREVDRLRPEDGAGFRRFVLAEVAALRRVLAAPAVTGERFHAARKIVSRQVSFFDDMRVLHPSPEHRAMSRALAAANGLMGAFHDELVARRAGGGRDYHHRTFALPDDIRTRLAALAAVYPSP